MAGLSKKEQWHRWRDKCRVEHRCVYCGKVRQVRDTRTDSCPGCRERHRAKAVKRQLDLREQNPPPFSRDPRKPFRFGRTRLKDQCRVECKMDFDVLELFDACRRNWITSPHYEPYQVSEFARRILALLQSDEHAIKYYGELQRGDRTGMRLGFRCDGANYAVLVRQMERTGCSISAALRDCLRYGCKLLLAMPDREAQRYLWPRRDEAVSDNSAKPTEPEQKCKPVTVVRVDKYRKYDLGDQRHESEF
jgi:hypothetical protein